MNLTMNTLLSTIDSTLYNGLSQITDTKQILQTAGKLSAPKLLPFIYLKPGEPDKSLIGNDSSKELLYHDYIVEIIVVTSYRTTQEASLTDSDNGLVQLMDDIENLLEAETLSKELTNSNIKVITYELSEEDFLDNIYTRGGMLQYTATERPYNSTIHRT